MAETPSAFARTKLCPPQRRHDLIARPRLNHLIEEDVSTHRLTLMAAPAGYGKTTAALAWSEFTNGFQALWITLDPLDDDLLRFLSLMVAALQGLNPACGQALTPTLAGQTSASREPERAFGLLINEILDCIPEPFAIILDDLHTLNHPALFAGLDYLIANLPAQMRLMATVRHEPPISLAILRSRGQMAEIGPPVLRFTEEETARLFGDGLKMDLPADIQQAIYSDTQGWVAGLRLLGELSDRNTLGEGEHPPGGLSKRKVFDLLAVEVLDKQGRDVRNFLLETSILDELTPELCAAVTEFPDAHRLLDEIYRRSLFMSAVYDRDSKVMSFRYHDLFGEFLRRQLERERPVDVKALHKRAGETHAEPARAVRHLLQADEYELAAQRMATEAAGLFAQGAFGQLRGWIEALPGETRQAHPWLIYYLGACQWVAYDLPSAASNLEKALSIFEVHGDVAGQGECQVLLSTLANTSGELEKSGWLLDAAEGKPVSTASRTQLYLNRAWIELEMPQSDVSASFEQALDLVESSQDPGALHIATMSLREIFCALPEGRRAARRLCGIIAARTSLEQVGIAQNTYYGLTATLRYLDGDIEGAVEAANRASLINRKLGGMPFLQGQVSLWMALAQRLQERWAAVATHNTELESLVPILPGWGALLLYPSGLLQWERGQVDEVKQILAKMEAPTGISEHVAAGFCRLILRGLIEIRDGPKETGTRAMQEAVELQRTYRYLYVAGDMRLGLAYANLQAGEPESALKAARLALDEWVQEDLPGMVLTLGRVILLPVLELCREHNVQREYACHLLELLERLTGAQAVKVPTTGETLTPREVEVLRMLAAGANNRLIAAELVISLATVKTHVSRILAKLDVRSRGQAVARARELQLL